MSYRPDLASLQGILKEYMFGQSPEPQAKFVKVQMLSILAADSMTGVWEAFRRATDEAIKEIEAEGGHCPRLIVQKDGQCIFHSPISDEMEFCLAYIPKQDHDPVESVLEGKQAA